MSHSYKDKNHPICFYCEENPLVGPAIRWTRLLGQYACGPCNSVFRTLREAPENDDEASQAHNFFFHKAKNWRRQRPKSFDPKEEEARREREQAAILQDAKDYAKKFLISPEERTE